MCVCVCSVSGCVCGCVFDDSLFDGIFLDQLDAKKRVTVVIKRSSLLLLSITSVDVSECRTSITQ